MAAPRTPQDRNAPVKRATRRQAPQPEAEIDQLEPMLDEVDGEGHDDDVSVFLGEREFAIPPRGQWRLSATSAARVGDFAGWAESVMSPEDAQAFLDADPTVDEMNTFFEDFGRAAGVSLGGSRASRRASARMARP